MDPNSRKKSEPGDWVGPVVSWILLLMIAGIFLNSVHEARAITCKQLRARRATTCKDAWELEMPPPDQDATAQH